MLLKNSKLNKRVSPLATKFKKMLTKTCPVSGQEFTITDEDLLFYKKMDVPTPTLCPKERERRRLAWRNESALYHRSCDGTGKKIISMHDAQQPYPVYDNEYWWGDDWDGLNYGVEFDFSKPFFEQFSLQIKRAPRMALIQQGQNSNSQFTNCSSYNKNGYLLFASNNNEDCLYGTSINNCKDCVDCFYCYDSEIGYQNIHSTFCYNTQYCEKVHFSNNMYYCADCRNSENCFACVSLWGRKGKYWILNKEVSKDVFKKVIATPTRQSEILKKLPALYEKQPQRYSPIIKCENSTGAYLRNSKNVHESWDCENLEDCKFCNNFFAAKSCYDVSYYGCTQTNELLYECESIGHGLFNSKFCKLCWGGGKNLEYCYECFKCEDCFGCIGLKSEKYCILNKQYTKDEYFELKEKIIQHMRRPTPNGAGEIEYGEFFPIQISPFGYNETIAQDYMPLSEKECKTREYSWKEKADSTKYDGPQYVVPEKITDVDQSICDKILTCQNTGQNYRIVKPEFEFYKKNNIPIPKFCPEERHHQRLKRKHPRHLWDRVCQQCNLSLKSPIDPKVSAQVYCETCFINIIN
jgi:hypothetical protein